MQFDPVRLFSSGYLVDQNPGTLALRNSAYLFAAISLAVSILLLVLLNRDLIKYSLERPKRLIITRFLKINLGLSIALLIVIFLRTQQLGFLSMRLWGVLVLALMFANLLAAVINLRRKIAKKNAPPVVGDDKITSTDFYQKYLPKKKKKK